MAFAFNLLNLIRANSPRVKTQLRDKALITNNLIKYLLIQLS